MKTLFYTGSAISILLIAVGMIQFDNFRDRLYLLAMLIMFVSASSGIAYLINKNK